LLLRWDESFHASQQEHLLHNPLDAALSGDGTLLAATSNAWGEQARLAPSKKMPLSNLCSQLIVRGIRKTA
jgi:hypothetical protein